MGISMCAVQAHAADLLVTVLDLGGNPVPNVAVYVESESLPRTSSGTVVMDQQNVRFVPHILVVQSGTSVQFPNNDDVAHHAAERAGHSGLGTDDIVVQTRRDRSGRSPGEERDRHSLHLREQSSSKVEYEPLTNARTTPALHDGQRSIGDRRCHCDRRQ